jgi:hypothetical protein
MPPRGVEVSHDVYASGLRAGGDLRVLGIVQAADEDREEK